MEVIIPLTEFCPEMKFYLKQGLSNIQCNDRRFVI